ncbi:MAG: hypothetical protein EBQ78_04600 [Betaproteobacteria bacterium]|jgi:hypothetical protein|nr:hypothetical protein [Betaproteobacteria bacterium]NBY16925.1 hypothetical protein [Betaproteobacteria bacterium]
MKAFLINPASQSATTIHLSSGLDEIRQLNALQHSIDLGSFLGIFERKAFEAAAHHLKPYWIRHCPLTGAAASSLAPDENSLCIGSHDDPALTPAIRIVNSA